MPLTILIFVIILGLLVFVHEFGHFIVAKKSGMQVREFGFGFPPRIAGIQKVNGRWRWVWAHRKMENAELGIKNEPIPAASSVPQNGAGQATQLFADSTIYSVNLIPLGGFVKILGENNDNENHPGSFVNKPFWPRFFTLIAGVAMNVILAWVLLSIGYMVGLPVAVDSAANIPAHTTFSQPQVAILDVTPGLPADKAGIKPNDIIVSINQQQFAVIPDIQNYIKEHAGSVVNFQIQRGRQDLSFKITPNPNPRPDEGAVGISLSIVGKLKYPWYYAVWEGAKTTYSALGQIVSGLGELITGKAGIAGVGGPVKIAQLVGQARQTGFMSLMTLTIMLSLSLAVLNILPFPALDGGRVLFLIIEKLRGRRNNQKVEQIVNTVGFVFLLLLMVAVTIKDIWNI